VVARGRGRRPEVEEALTCGPHTSAGERERERERRAGAGGPASAERGSWAARGKEGVIEFVLFFFFFLFFSNPF
jgi:hypothetical protein